VLKWATLLVVAVVVAVLVFAPVLASSQAEKLYVVEVVPAPVGYSLTFHEARPARISGYRDSLGNFYPYRANVGETGVLLIVSGRLNVERLISREETSLVQFVDVVGAGEAYAIAEHRGGFLVVHGGGLLFYSHYDVYAKAEPPPGATGRVLVAYEDYVNFDLAKNYTVALFSTSPQHSVTVVLRRDFSLSTRLADLLGVDEACIARFEEREDVPWRGGVIVSPTCARNLEVFRTYTYKGSPYAVVFSANTRYGKIDYVVMAPLSSRTMVEAGLLSYVLAPPELHIVKLDRDDVFIYRAFSFDSLAWRIPVVKVIDVTQTVSGEKGEKRRVCVLPARAEVEFALLWRSRELEGTVTLEPGEVILYKLENTMYTCRGDMSWLEFDDIPYIRGPAYREFKHPIYISSGSGKFLAVTSNGKVYLTSNLEIPFRIYEENELFVYKAGGVTRVQLAQTSIVTTPFFVLGVLVLAVLASTIVFGRSRPEKEAKLKVVIDLPEPKPLTLASSESLGPLLRKHVDMFGVCPDIYEVVLYHKVLPPLPDKVVDPSEVLMCPFSTNPETERVLRAVAEVFHHAMWAVRRAGKSRGFIYTLVGDTMLYYYWYKVEGERKPEEVIVRAVEAAYRTRPQYPYHMYPLGLVIVAEGELARAVEREVSYMQVLSGGDERSRGYALSSYLSVRKGVSPRHIEADALQNFLNEKIPSIIVVSSDTLTRLIEHAAERVASYSELYYGEMRGERHEGRRR